MGCETRVDFLIDSAISARYCCICAFRLVCDIMYARQMFAHLFRCDLRRVSIAVYIESICRSSAPPPANILSCVQIIYTK